MRVKSIAAITVAAILAASAASAEQFNCRRDVPPGGAVSLNLYNANHCEEALQGPVDCLHWALAACGQPGYATFASVPSQSTQLGGGNAFFPLWCPMPGWFHVPQLPAKTPGLNRVTLINVSTVTQTMRVVGIGYAANADGKCGPPPPSH